MINPARKRATIEDVADMAGVSIKTVSRVINKEQSVRQITQQKVLDAIAALDYRPSLSARGMGGNRSYLLALVYDNPSANYVVQVQRGVLDECRKEGFELVIHPCDHRDDNFIEEVEKVLWNSRADGLILTPPLSENAALLQKLDAQAARYVCITAAFQGLSALSVISDERNAAREMTRHLIELGHRRIGFIQGHPDHQSAHERLVGFNDALAEAGIKPKKTLVKAGLYTFASGLVAANKLLDLKVPPTAIFASNDDMAMGAIRAAYERRLKVPGDLSVAGFDDTPAARQNWPSLTTVKQPIEEIARSATVALVDWLRSGEIKGMANVVELSSKIKIRQSTGPVPVG